MIPVLNIPFLGQRCPLKARRVSFSLCMIKPSFTELFPGVQVRLMSRADLTAASDLGVECFFQPRLKVNESDSRFTHFEYSLLKKIVSLSTHIEKIDAWLSNYIGFGNRAGKRLDSPQNWRASDDSLIIVAVSISSSELSECSSSHLLGLVELCLEKPTGLLTPPLRRIDFFGLFPVGKATAGSGYRPYLCNLSVAPMGRRRGLGRYLCRLCESVARDLWGYDELYLHVQEENEAAQRLYEGMGYTQRRLLSAKQIKEENMENIRFYGRDLRTPAEATMLRSISPSSSSSFSTITVR